MTQEQLEYLKTWIERTRSDANANLVPDVLNNLNELERYVRGFETNDSNKIEKG